MITLSNISLFYNKKPVFQCLNLFFLPNTIYGLVGKNGIGKTSLLKSILGLIKIDEGTISHSKDKNINDVCALVLNEDFMYPQLFPLEFLTYYLSINNKEIKFNIMENWIDYLEIPKTTKIGELSTGNYKKISLLSRILIKRDFLMLDEPYNSLDSISCSKLNKIFKKYKTEHKSIILSSHIVEPLIEICDKIIYMQSASLITIFDRNDFIIFKNAFLNESTSISMGDFS